MPEAGTVMIISDESNNSLTTVMVSVFPVSVVAPPLAPPKMAVSGRVLGEVGHVKAEADAARPSTNNDCFMVAVVLLLRIINNYYRAACGGSVAVA